MELALREATYVQEMPCVRNGVFPAVSVNRGCHRQQRLQPPQVLSWGAPRELRKQTILGTQRHPTPALLPGKSHGQRSLVGCSPWSREESDTTERLPFHFSLSCIGEGNGNPLQYSCLEKPGTGEPGGLLSMGSHRVGHD